MSNIESANDTDLPSSAPSLLATELAKLAPAFDVFLAHNGEDKAVVERIATRLKRAGIKPWLDKWQLVSGGTWIAELGAGVLQARLACVVFIGPHGRGLWQDEEIMVALDRAAKDRTFRVVPVLLPGLPDILESGIVPPFLTTRTWVDLRAGLEDPDAIQALINAIHGVASQTAHSVENNAGDTCPYRGLEAFDEARAPFFHGRDGDVQRLLEKLKGQRFLAVLGPSGSGKSSVVQAGMLPALRRGALPDSDIWLTQVMTPGRRPLTALASRLSLLYPQRSINSTLDDLATDLRSFDLATSLILAQQSSAQQSSAPRFLWVIDQAEEVFTLCQDDAERAQFLANLVYASSHSGGQAVIVLTMRADFYARCAPYPDLCALVSGNQYLISPLSRDGLRQAIEEPAAQVGLEFEQGLVETILEDVAQQPGALPLLEHALFEVWKLRRGRLLTLEGYRQTGGVQGALAKTAEDVYAILSIEQQGITRRTLLRLTQPGEGAEDTRRRATFDELVTRGDERLSVDGVVHALADKRLLTTSTDEQTGAELVDVSHEALIRNWPRLRDWVEQDRTGLRIHHRLSEAAAEWQRLGRDRDLLYRGARLNETLEWRARNESALNEVEQAFLDTCVALQDRDRRSARQRVHLTIGTLVVTVVVVASFALLAMFQREEALSQRNSAEENRLVTLSRELSATARFHTSDEPEVSLLLAEEAWKTRATPEADEALRTALWLSPFRARMQGGEGVVTSAAFSPDQSRIVTVAQVGLRVWDAHTGAVLATMPTSLNWVTAAAFSPDSGWVVGASSDGTAQVWDAYTGKLDAQLSGRTGPITAPGFSSPSGSWAVTAGGTDKPVRVWDLSTGRTLTELNTDAQRPNLRSAFSSDGSLVVTAEADAARVWVASTGSERSMLRGHTGDVTHVAFIPGTTRVVTASLDTVRVWETSTGSEKWTLHGLANGIMSMSVSPDGTRVVAGDRSGTVWMWDVDSGKPIAELPGHFGSIFKVAFSPDSIWAVSSGADGQVEVWEASTGQLVNRFQAHRNAIWDATFSLDGRRLVTASADNSARIWASRTGGVATELRGHAGGVASAVFNSDATKVATTSADGTARLWEASTGRQISQFDGIPSMPNRGVLSTDGRILTAAGLMGMPQVREVATGILLPIFSGQAGPGLRTLAISPNGELVVAASTGTVPKLWDTRTGQSFKEIGVRSSRPPVAGFSPDAKRVLLVTDTVSASELSLWDSSSGGRVLNVATSQPLRRLNGVALSADYRWAVTTHGVSFAADDNYALVWDLASSNPEPLARLTLHNGPVTTAVFSPDGHWLATASFDGTARLWSTASWRPTVVLSGHTKAVRSVAFSPDSTELVTASADGTARIYRCEVCAPVGNLLGLVRTRVDRELTAEEREHWIHEPPAGGP
jgi:WD40 repeat protein